MKLMISLTTEQVQRSLRILGQAPYVEIADVIDAIKAQANEQLNSRSENQEHQGDSNDLGHEDLVE